MKRANNSDNWQQEFIATNLLAIGYNAWQGYLSSDRGLVVCSTNSPELGVVGETFQVHFVPRQRLAPFLNAWLAAPDTVLLKGHFTNAHILKAVDNYNPEKDAVFLLEFGTNVTFFYLTNLPIIPPTCYEQILKYWDEFQTQESSQDQKFNHR
jgi:hypothetical protein